MQDQKRDTDQAIDRQKTPNSSIKATYAFCLGEHDHLCFSQSSFQFDPFIPFGEIPRPNSMRLDEEKVR